ncbi:MAG: nucleoside-diphosphate kinase [Candidatus Cloacimonetes bacterium]|nr:nucleoside-diphosphate kinase [Candidatus Cloacimonadota bacterium]MCF7813389.1 nucleoside-diphosphate kinase [Candidatus Cloacimonadota bacterium]MCF7867486.1 nucleoside-diphosphate kinase [Candidatus Cloacimonadota bacterium]MCF7883011.1 nucleoside-diphosphate kinase [Candidatus Cloacimonadota bacterium]
MKENTLLLIKPDATGRNEIGRILAKVEENGFEINKLKMFKMDNELANKFYAEHVGKPFFPDLSEFMMSGKIIGAMLTREDAILKLRELVGNTDSTKANLGSIRAVHGTSKGENSVHASDSPESAKRELGLIFP